MTNYTIIDNNLITNLKISDGAYRCYNLLLSMAHGDKTTCFPSIKYLACALGRCERTINRYIKELVSLKLIIKRRRGSISNLYILVQKKINNAVDHLKQTVKGNKDNIKKADTQNCSHGGKNKSNYKNNYKNSYTNMQRTDFNNYQQRNYNYNNLEKMLLGEMEYNPELL
ncbi:helix-turn-helix domain-containing protein [Clostridium brassicae]|uniref:Helix-turn-helix domain-containing protein n=1 Tax=Clostridium brassicae TaxID=2999072 RepID=A0ABT4DAZ6_9CLOT|nr:helix-turn-helix domain-containing protein [Clostridium brassicae]MCY6958306.1 helix-turn-helix domain-containing protein [Clostridium brassicae]